MTLACLSGYKYSLSWCSLQSLTQFTVNTAWHWANTLLPGNKSHTWRTSRVTKSSVSLLSGTARHSQNSGTPPAQTAQHRTRLLSQRSGNRTSPPSFDLLSLSQLSILMSVNGDVVVSAPVYPYSQIYPAPQRCLSDSAEWSRSSLTWSQFATSRICE